MLHFLPLGVALVATLAVGAPGATTLVNPYLFAAGPTAATYYATSSVSGDADTPANALGAPNATWTTDSGCESWTHRWQIAGSPSATPTGTQSLRLTVRKDNTQTPTVSSITIYYGGSVHQTISTGWSVTSTSSQNIDVTFTAPAGNTIDVSIATTAACGMPTASRAAVQLDAITWSATVN